MTDVVRISDSRMSGTSYGTVVLHVSPEAADGGTLALVEEGDWIKLDVAARRLHLDVADDDWRAAATTGNHRQPITCVDIRDSTSTTCCKRMKAVILISCGRAAMTH